MAMLTKPHASRRSWLKSGPSIWVAVALTLPFGSASAQAPDRRLELEEVGRASLPPGFTVLSGLLIGAGHAIVWGPSGLLDVTEGRQRRVFVLGERVPVRGARVGRESASYEVIDSAGDIVDVAGSGDTRITVRLPLEGEVVQAVPLGDGWLIHEKVGHDVMPRLVVWQPGTGLRALAPPHGGWNRQLRLVPGEGSAFVQDMDDPYAVWRVELRDQIPEVGLAMNGETIRSILASEGLEPENTVALPLVPLDDGYLYQLSHLGSDGRMMITLDETYEVLRSAMVPVSIGFMAAVPEQNALLGLVDTGTPKVVFYRWRWSGGSGQSSTSTEDLPGDSC